MPDLTGRWPFQYPAGDAAFVPWQGHFQNQASSIADALNAYQLPIAVDDATERDALFPSPTSGDRVFRRDLMSEQVYRSAAWRSPSLAKGRAARTSNQSVANGSTFILMNLSSVVAVDLTFASNAFTIPYDGMYFVDATVVYVPNARGNRAANIFINGVEETSAGSLNNGVAGNSTPVPISHTLQLSAGDVVDLRSWQTSGGALNSSKAYLNITRLGD
jgi:hypothetical protein